MGQKVLILIKRILVTNANINYLLLDAPEINTNSQILIPILRQKPKRIAIPILKEPNEIRLIQPSNTRLVSQTEEILGYICLGNFTFKDMHNKKHTINTGEHLPIC